MHAVDDLTRAKVAQSTFRHDRSSCYLEWSDEVRMKPCLGIEMLRLSSRFRKMQPFNSTVCDV